MSEYNLDFKESRMLAQTPITNGYPKYFYQALQAEGKAYLLGNMNGSDELSIFNLIDNSWENIPALGGYQRLLFFEGSLYSIIVSNNKNQVQIFNVLKKVWEIKSESPEFLTYNLAWSATVNGKFYFGGGPQVFEYDPLLDTWKQKPRLLSSSPGQEATVLDGKIYLVDSDGVLQVYDPASEP